MIKSVTVKSVKAFKLRMWLPLFAQGGGACLRSEGANFFSGLDAFSVRVFVLMANRKTARRVSTYTYTILVRS